MKYLPTQLKRYYKYDSTNIGIFGEFGYCTCIWKLRKNTVRLSFCRITLTSNCKVCNTRHWCLGQNGILWPDSDKMLNIFTTRPFNTSLSTRDYKFFNKRIL